MNNAVFLGLCLHICTVIFAQEAGPYLDLSGAVPAWEKHAFSFEVSPYCKDRIDEISGEKFKIPTIKIIYDGIPLETKSCKTRGRSTLYFKRKSFSISLLEPLVLGECEIKRLALNSLVMDQNYYRNRLSFLLMEKIGIFHLENAFTELRINGKSAGIYLAIQKPEDYIRSLNSPLLTRREYKGRYTLEYASCEDAREQMKRLRNIPKLTNALEGQQLFDSLNEVLHMDQYFKWLAFNYLIKNGDYTDELFLFLASDENRFDIIPWDYDDIFQRQPHESYERRNKVLDHKLLFSGEAYLDIVIDQDSILYLKFLNGFQEVLELLTPEVIKETFERVYAELYPYYTDMEIIAQSESDHYGPTVLNILKEDLRHQFYNVLIQRKSIETIIDAELRRLEE
jgi:spore coat protein H